MKQLGLAFASAIFIITSFAQVMHSSTIYYLSPTGSDSNSGTSASAPWKTFQHAIPKLKPGDALTLENGTYSSSNSGYPSINCSGNASNGTSTSTITIMAQNERQAFIKGDGSAYGFSINNCKYWNVVGLHIEMGDFKGSDYHPDVMYIYNSSYLFVRRNIFAHNNRYTNSHLIDNYSSSHNTFEENEFYYFHRHGILDMYGAYNIYRRNYFNSRNYADISGGYSSNNPSRGDASIVFYPAHDAISENNISEGQNEGAGGVQCLYVSGSNTCNNNKYLGNISIGDVYGHLIKARGTGDSYMPHNNDIENDVVINPQATGIFLRANKNGNCTNCTIFANSSSTSGYVADPGGSGETGDGNYSVSVNNSMVMGTNNPEYGFSVEQQSGNWTWNETSVNAYGSPWNFYPKLPNSHVQDGSSSNPVMGTCLVWIPSNSVLKGAGNNGKDIGANVLYRYQNGALTSTRLWDKTTGKFPQGAIVSGLNDKAGSSLMDVNKRLNVNTNGCLFPSGY